MEISCKCKVENKQFKSLKELISPSYCLSVKNQHGTVNFQLKLPICLKITNDELDELQNIVGVPWVEINYKS